MKKIKSKVIGNKKFFYNSLKQVKNQMSNRFEWDDTNSSGIWWSTNVSIRDECILLKEDTECDDTDIVELLRSIAQNIEDNGL